MGKATMCINMLQLLNSGRVYKVSELASLLDTNPRNIIEYKKELDECGYYIDTIPGRYGGYQINQSCVIPSVKLLPNEVDSLDKAMDYLLKRNDFFLKEEYQRAISKIYSSISKKTFRDEIAIINRFPLSMKEEDIKVRYDIIQESITLKRCVKIRYLSQKNKERDHIFHPYDLFMYNNAWFVIGWCETFSDIIYFKINRITNIEKIDKKFSKFRYYNKSDYIDEFGFKNNGDWYHVEFIAKGTYASLVKERIYGKNQEVIPIDESNTLVKVDMQNKESIIVFILGFNKNIQVIEPDWLKDELIDTANKILELYK